MLRARLSALEQARLITSDIAARLATENQANDRNRAGRIWFVFHPPHRAGQDSLERLFRSWGGEALYNSHESDPATGPILRRIGIPCVITADVPIASLRPHSYLSINLIRRYFVNRGWATAESIDHEDCAVRAIPASSIIAITMFPEHAFVEMTRCNTWVPQLR